MAGNHQVKCTGTFVIKIYDSQNATWQGQVTWAEKNQTISFRSDLELLKLIDSTMEIDASRSGWNTGEEGARNQ